MPSRAVSIAEGKRMGRRIKARWTNRPGAISRSRTVRPRSAKRYPPAWPCYGTITDAPLPEGAREDFTNRKYYGFNDIRRHALAGMILREQKRLAIRLP